MSEDTMVDDQEKWVEIIEELLRESYFNDELIPSFSKDERNELLSSCKKIISRESLSDRSKVLLCFCLRLFYEILEHE